MSDSHPTEISKKTYVNIFIALMVLMVLTVAASRVHFRLAWLGVVLAMTIALVKAWLVVVYFMHVKVASRLTKIFVIASIFWLGILGVLTLSDYLTRSYFPMSRGWTDRADAQPIQIPPPPGSQK